LAERSGFTKKTVNDMAAKQQTELAPLRDANDALKVASEENRKSIESTNKLLRDAIAKREADMFRTDEELQKLNIERMDALAEAIAKKVQPYNPLPKSPEEAERMQTEQVDKVSNRMTERIQPILTEMSKDQNLTRDAIAQYSQRISDQVGKRLSKSWCFQLLSSCQPPPYSMCSGFLKLTSPVSNRSLS